MSYTLAFVLSLMSVPSIEPAIRTDSIRSDAGIRASALRHSPDVRKCYETEGLARNPSLTGSVEVVLTILPTGAVSEVEIDTEQLRGVGKAEVAKCLETAARRWTFDRGPYVVETVILPFQLSREASRGQTAVRTSIAQD